MLKRGLQCFQKKIKFSKIKICKYIIYINLTQPYLTQPFFSKIIRIKKTLNHLLDFEFQNIRKIKEGADFSNWNV